MTSYTLYSILPDWFWRLLPILSQRQSTDHFEQWLYGSEAPLYFPDTIYQKLLWVNYHNKDYQENIYNILREYDQLSERMHDIYAFVGLFTPPQAGEWWHGCTPYLQAKTYDLWPLLPEYMYQIDHFLGGIALYAEEENLTEDRQILTRYLEKLYQHLAWQHPQPEIPEYF